MKVRTITIAAAGTLFGAVLAFAVPASAGGADARTAAPTVTPTPTPTQLPTVPPTVNPFAGCNFTTTFDFTFDPGTGRFVRGTVPAIVCDQGGRVRVFDLVTNGRR